MHICKDDKLFLMGKRNLAGGLWDIYFPKKNMMNYIIQRDKYETDLESFIYGCASSPVISIFQYGINKGNFIAWPGIDGLNFK